jgi:hypothetical protein
MLAAWAPSRTIMDVLGHSAIGVTMNTYAHVVMQVRKDAADAGSAALLPAAWPLRLAELGALGGTRPPQPSDPWRSAGRSATRSCIS